MAPYIWPRSEPPAVLDLIDSLTLNLESRRKQASGLMRLAYELEYRRMGSYERAAVNRFPALLVTSQADADALGEGIRGWGSGISNNSPDHTNPQPPTPGPSKIHVLPMGVDLDRFPFRGIGGREPATLIFTGNMGYQPNEEAVLWFAEHVWPRVKATHPGAKWQVVGANPRKRVRALVQGAGDSGSAISNDSLDAANPQSLIPDPSRGIEVPGWVPDVGDYLGKATVAVCPLQSGSGIQMKVQEAMAAGIPVVATSTANRGVGGLPDRDLLVADSPEQFATAVTRLLSEPAVRDQLAKAGRAYVEKHFRWERHVHQLSTIYASVLNRGDA
jgi:glycosyltransferase involved in cell wall biosynthesis